MRRRRRQSPPQFPNYNPCQYLLWEVGCPAEVVKEVEVVVLGDVEGKVEKALTKDGGCLARVD